MRSALRIDQIAPVAFVVALLVLVGCGSGAGDPPGSSRETSSASVHITWPPRPAVRGRVIPEATESIQVTITAGSNTVATSVVDRPYAYAESIVVLFGLPVGDLDAEAKAYSLSEARGTELASGSSSFRTHAGERAIVDVDMTATGNTP